MALPNVPLPKSSVEVGGTVVNFRSLTRREALKVTTNFKEDPDGAEIYLLALGAGISEEEAKAWREATDPIEAGKLIDGIIYLTGLADPPKKKEGSDQKNA